jgi:alpha-beta hydrolase superfamily lysophospholipase
MSAILNLFPDAAGAFYWPNHLITSAINCGATVGDAVGASQPAIAVARAGHGIASPEFAAAMVRGYTGEVARIERQMQAHAHAGDAQSMAESGLRITALLDALDWFFWPFGDPDPAAAGTAFRRSRGAFRQAVAALPGHHWVAIPFEGHTLDGLLLLPPGTDRPPVILHLNGQHSSLHWHYLMGLHARLAARGLASLSFDHPGTGSARYDRGLPIRPDTESYAAAAIDWLEADGRTDATRVGAVGGSLGGYRVPRAMAFERRIAAGIAWGAHYELYDSVRIDWPTIGPLIPTGGPFPSDAAPVLAGLYYWTGTKNLAQLDRAIRAIDLSPDILARIRGDLMVVHGAEDVQLPFWHAERTVAEAIDARSATLLAVGVADGGSQHCNWDNPAHSLNRMADWLARRLLPRG